MLTKYRSSIIIEVSRIGVISTTLAAQQRNPYPHAILGILQNTFVMAALAMTAACHVLTRKRGKQVGDDGMSLGPYPSSATLVPPTKNPVYKRDFEVESNLRGIPLGSGMGNITRIEALRNGDTPKTSPSPPKKEWLKSVPKLDMSSIHSVGSTNNLLSGASDKRQSYTDRKSWFGSTVYLGSDAGLASTSTIAVNDYSMQESTTKLGRVNEDPMMGSGGKGRDRGRANHSWLASRHRYNQSESFWLKLGGIVKMVDVERYSTDIHGVRRGRTGGEFAV